MYGTSCKPCNCNAIGSNSTQVSTVTILKYMYVDYETAAPTLVVHVLFCILIHIHVYLSLCVFDT